MQSLPATGNSGYSANAGSQREGSVGAWRRTLRPSLCPSYEIAVLRLACMRWGAGSVLAQRGRGRQEPEIKGV